MNRIGTAATILAVSNGLLISGCGGATPPESFASRAGAICARAERQVRDAARAAPAAGGTGLPWRYAARLRAIVTDELAALRTLPPPAPGRAPSVARYLAALGRVQRDLAVLARPAAAAGDAAAAAATDLRESPAATLAAAAGLPACAGGGTR